MAVELLPLCSIPKIAIRDGYTGATARLWLPYDQSVLVNGLLLVSNILSLGSTFLNRKV